MRLGVISSRYVTDYKLANAWLNAVILNSKLSSAHVTIVTGECNDVGTVALQYAVCNSMNMMLHYPDYEHYGKIAAHMRNKLLVADIDMLVAFVDNECHYVQDIVLLTKESNKPIILIDI
jgi:hypothetical protein